MSAESKVVLLAENETETERGLHSDIAEKELIGTPNGFKGPEPDSSSSSMQT